MNNPVTRVVVHCRVYWQAKKSLYLKIFQFAHFAWFQIFFHILASSFTCIMTSGIALTKTSRIPANLQAVFIAASLGKEIDKPPPQTATLDFYLEWIREASKEEEKPCDATVTTTDSGSTRLSSWSPRKKPNLLKSSRRKSSSSVKKESKRKSKEQAAEPENGPVPITVRTTIAFVSILKYCVAQSFTFSLSQDFKPKKISPQTYITCILRNRGYCTKEYPALQTAYFNEPTPLQEASFGPYVVEVLRRGDLNALRGMLRVGLSPDACNRHCESLVHMACQLGKPEILETLLQFQCHVRVADSRGRTPLHDACWAKEPNLQIIEMILHVDRHLLFIADCRGILPLSYLKEDHWNKFTKFFMAKKDLIWPDRDMIVNGVEPDPPLTQLPPNSCPLAVPERDISPNLAAMVAEGKISPEEIEFLIDSDDDMSESSDTFFDCEEELDFDDLEDDTITSIDEDEMETILHNIGTSNPLQWSI